MVSLEICFKGNANLSYHCNEKNHWSLESFDLMDISIFTFDVFFFFFRGIILCIKRFFYEGDFQWMLDIKKEEKSFEDCGDDFSSMSTFALLMPIFLAIINQDFILKKLTDDCRYDMK